MARVSPPTVPAQAGRWRWGELAPRNQSSQQRSNTRPDRRDTQPVRRRGAPAHPSQTALEKAYKRDSTFEWSQDPPVRTASAAAGPGKPPLTLRKAGFTSLGIMNAKYAQEMILIPKPSYPREQSGGQATAPDTTDQFWQRRLLVDQLTTAPHVDRMMRLLGDMKQIEGQVLPSRLPGQEPNSSDYFRLQGKLKNIPAQPVKRPLPTKATAATAAAAATVPRARPTIPSSFEEAAQQQAEIQKSLDGYEKKAKEAMEEALKWGDKEAKKRIIIIGSPPPSSRICESPRQTLSNRL